MPDTHRPVHCHRAPVAQRAFRQQVKAVGWWCSYPDRLPDGGKHREQHRGGISIRLNASTTLAGDTEVRGNDASSVGSMYARSTLNVGSDCRLTDNLDGGIAIENEVAIGGAATALVCGNTPFQCFGFNDPAACQELCPPA